MPDRPNLGYASALGAEGGFEALHAIIARRKLDEDRAIAQQEIARKAQLEQARFAEVQRASLAQEQRLGEQTDALNAWRAGETAENVAKQKREEAMLLKAETDKQAAIAEIQGNPNIPDFNKQLMILGIRQGKFDPSDATLQKPMSREEALADFKDRERIKAMFDKSGAAGQQRSPFFTTVPHTGSATGTGVFDARTARVYPLGADGIPIGMSPQQYAAMGITPNQMSAQTQGAQTASAFGLPEPGPGPYVPPTSALIGGAAKKPIDKAKEADALIAKLDQVESVGEKLNWESVAHTGPLAGPLKSKAVEWNLIDDPLGNEMRTTISYMRGLIGHDMFGAAFTASEQELLRQFAADLSVPGKVNAQRVQAMRNLIQHGRDNYLQGLDYRSQRSAPQQNNANDPLGVLRFRGGQ